MRTYRSLRPSETQDWAQCALSGSRDHRVNSVLGSKVVRLVGAISGNSPGALTKV